MKNRISIADTFIISGLCAIIFPSNFLIGFATAFFFLLIKNNWIDLKRKQLVTFVPDPLNPDFKALSKILKESISRAAANDGNTNLLLSAVYLSNGKFIPYELDWNAKDHDIIIRFNGKETHRHCDAPIRIRSVLPIRIIDECRLLIIRKSSDVHPSAEWFISFSNNDLPPSTFRIFYHFYIAAWIWLYLFVADPDIFPLAKLFVMSAMPGIVFQVFSFQSRIQHFLKIQIDFFGRLFRRFFSRSNHL